MKSWKNLFQLMIDKNNILQAMQSAAKDKGDYKSVKKAAADPQAYADRLISSLKDNTWKPAKHTPFVINDGISQKQRTIIKPTYNEQVVHHAIIQVLEPIFMYSMYDFSCGSIPNRGATYGKKYLQKYINKHPNDCEYCLKIDIRHFFESINQDELLTMLNRKINDDEMMKLLALIIKSEGEKGIGIPIGFYTSQWFSNYFLESLDHHIKEELHAKCYVRYMDDMVILDSDKSKLRQMLNRINTFLISIGLELKGNWQIFKFGNRFIDFMGFRFYKNKVTLRRSIFLRACRKAIRIKKSTVITWYSSCQMIAYLGYLSQADTYKIFIDKIKPLLNIKNLKKIVSNHDRKKDSNGILYFRVCGA